MALWKIIILLIGTPIALYILVYTVSYAIKFGTMEAFFDAIKKHSVKNNNETKGEN